MENSASQASKHLQNPSGVVDDAEALLLSFESFALSNSVNIRFSGLGGSASQSENIAPPSISTIFSTEEEEEAEENSNRIKDRWLQLAQETSRNPEWFSQTSAADHDRIWGYHWLMTIGDCSTSNVRHNGGQKNTLMGSQEYNNWHLDSSAPQSSSFAAGSSSGQSTTMRSNFCDYPSSSSNFVSLSTPLLSDGFYPVNTTNNINLRRTSNCLLNQRGQVDAMMFFLFHKLTNARGEDELNLLIRKILSQKELLINTAFCKNGVTFVLNLIKKIKKSPHRVYHHAFTLTKILSTRFLDIMTHNTARNVITECLTIFGSKPNEILYEKAILHCEELATHQVGCRSLNERIIKYIAGEQRSKLLFCIANISDYLSNHPYGNYVVQEVLKLRDMYSTHLILVQLKGQFVDLSLKQGGSKVVEGCMELGSIRVVREILKCPKVPSLLAKDLYGNYVIQKALKKTKEFGFYCLYNSLVKSLEPYYQELSQTIGGRRVLCLLRG